MNDPTGLPATEGDSAKAAPPTTLLPGEQASLALAPDAGGQGPAITRMDEAFLALAVIRGCEACTEMHSRARARWVEIMDRAVADAGHIGRL